MGRIVRVISKDASVVCSAIDGKDIVSRIEEIHKTSAVVTAALGRLAMGTWDLDLKAKMILLL